MNDIEGFLQKHWRIIVGFTAATAIAGGLVYSTTSKSGTRKPTIKVEKKKKETYSTNAASPISLDLNSASSLPENVPLVQNAQELALKAKNDGNQLYTLKQFEEAIKKYTEAIKLSPNAVYYCNRAACYSNLKEYRKAISDCDEAIKLDKTYIKAFHRRALAYEALDDLKQALFEFTVICALEGFKNQASMAAPDRLLKILSARRTKDILENKVYIIPSETFVSAYMDSFRATPSDSSIVLDLESDTESDTLLKKTFEAAASRKWKESYDFCQQAIVADSFSSDIIRAKALNYRGTVNFLMGKVEDAVTDLEESLALEPENINTLIKRATLHMERGEVDKTIEQFSKAEKISGRHPDLFYHRGQVRFLTGDFAGAIDDYSFSLAMEKAQESSVYVHIQMGVAQYKQGELSSAEKKFRELKVSFPNSAEVWNYHGEILMDKQAYAEAEKSFDKAMEMDKASPLPYINKAILQLQWKQDAAKAIEYCRKAIEFDPLCDIAYTQLAQLLCMQNDLEEAIEVYEKSIAIARTEAEIMNVVSCQEAAIAQQYVVKHYPEVMNDLRQQEQDPQ